MKTIPPDDDHVIRKWGASIAQSRVLAELGKESVDFTDQETQYTQAGQHEDIANELAPKRVWIHIAVTHRGQGDHCVPDCVNEIVDIRIVAGSLKPNQQPQENKIDG